MTRSTEKITAALVTVHTKYISVLIQRPGMLISLFISLAIPRSRRS